MLTSTTEFMVRGTHCTACKALIEDVCAELPGVKRCTVNYTTGQTTVVHEPAIDIRQIVAAIDELGPYQVVRPVMIGTQHI